VPPRGRRGATVAWPDDDHVPRAILGDDGGVLAVAHVSPDAGPVVFEHLRTVVEAARRMMAADDTPERRARVEAAQVRNRERLERIRGTVRDARARGPGGPTADSLDPPEAW
jgi:hypothetical protein